MVSDPSTWSLRDSLMNVPIKSWIAIGSFFLSALAVAFGAGRWLGRRSKSKEVESVQEELDNEKKSPKITIKSGPREAPIGRVAQHLRYSFTRAPYIHPGIIQVLTGWLSDGLPVEAAMDLEGAMNSNKFIEPIEVYASPDGCKWIRAAKEGGIPRFGSAKGEFSYRYLGSSSSGICVLETANWGGGSGVFCAILLLVFEADIYMDPLDQNQPCRDRILLKCVGQIPLGDRYGGKVELCGNELRIGKDSRPIMLRGPIAEDASIRIDE